MRFSSKVHYLNPCKLSGFVSRVADYQNMLTDFIQRWSSLLFKCIHI